MNLKNVKKTETERNIRKKGKKREKEKETMEAKKEFTRLVD